MVEIGATIERFWEVVCGFYPFWATLLVINIVFALLLGISLVFLNASANPETLVISVIDAVIILISISGLVLLLRRCKQRQHGY